MREKKPLLIFDFFGVVVGEVAHTWLKKHLHSDKAQQVIESVLVEADEGKLSETQLFATLESVTGVKADLIKKDWFELGQLNTETLSFIKQHKKDYHFALLSNAIESYIKQYFDMFNLYGVFDEVYISSVIRLAKPNRAIFDYVLATFPHPYSYAIMIDDSTHNIEGAKNAGLEGIVFKQMAQTERDINTLTNRTI